MGFASVSRVTVAGHNSLRETVIEELQETGAVEVVDLREESDSAEWGDMLSPEDSSEADAKLKKVEYCLRVLTPYEEKKGLLSRLAAPRPEKSRQELTALASTFNLDGLVERCEGAVKKLQELSNREESLKALARTLGPWSLLSLSLEEAEGTRTTRWLFGFVPAGMIERLQEMISERAPECSVVDVLDRSVENAPCVLVCAKQRIEELESILREVGWAEARLPVLKGRPSDILRELAGKEEEIKDSRMMLGRELVQLLLETRTSLLALSDYYANLRQRELALGGGARSSQAFLIQGWVKKESLPRVRERIEKAAEGVAVFARDPLPDENPPVILQNSSFATPFETVIGMYSLPSHGELDPTPFVAPFFFVFFGLCVGDVIYGTTMVAIALIALKKLGRSPRIRKFLRLVLLCGISTIICGAVTGSWAGINLDRVPSWMGFMKRLRLFDPLSQSMTFFILSLALGYIHLALALGIRLVRDLRAGKRWSATFAGGGWMLLLISGLLLVAGMKDVAGVTALVGAGSIGLLSGLGSPSKVAGVLKALFLELLSNGKDFIANVLSYTRLMALGLTSSVIALVINIVAGILTAASPWAWIAAAPMLVLAHAGNLALNCLGGFVHTSRLQFVEFFPYFFQGGGRAFRPLEKRYRHVEVTG